MCESIVEHEGTDSDTYDQFDFASQMAVLRHILFFFRGSGMGSFKECSIEGNCGTRSIGIHIMSRETNPEWFILRTAA